MRPKTCKVCREKFIPQRSLQVACGLDCAITHSRNLEEKKRKERLKAFRRETRARKEALKTRSDFLREAQSAFNAYIRARDRVEPCISCNVDSVKEYLRGGGWDCGHYRSVGSAPELRFEEFNAHKQCKRCNRDMSGNHSEMRKGVLARIGQERLEWIEGPHEPKKYTIEELKEIKAKYRKKLKEVA